MTAGRHFGRIQSLGRHMGDNPIASAVPLTAWPAPPGSLSILPDQPGCVAVEFRTDIRLSLLHNQQLQVLSIRPEIFIVVKTEISRYRPR